MEKLLLVDFENVQRFDLARLDNDVRIVIYVGASQKSVPIELVKRLQDLGKRVEWQKVEGNGSNALDFFIACHLGRVLEQSLQIQCIVLSNDKGFDPLLRHLNQSGLKCRRINRIADLDPKAYPADGSEFARVVEVLRKSEKKSRPRKRKTLSGWIASIFQKKLDPEVIDHIIDMLFTKKMVSETANAIVYHF
jgi:hypothetical protein